MTGLRFPVAGGAVWRRATAARTSWDSRPTRPLPWRRRGSGFDGPSPRDVAGVAVVGLGCVLEYEAVGVDPHDSGRGWSI